MIKKYKSKPKTIEAIEYTGANQQICDHKNTHLQNGVCLNCGDDIKIEAEHITNQQIADLLEVAKAAEEHLRQYDCMTSYGPLNIALEKWRKHHED